MSESREELPCFKFKEGVKLGTTKKLKLDCAKPVKTGETQYGEWRLWFGFVEDATVFWGRKPSEKEETGYTGKVLFFPSDKLNSDLISAANGNSGVEVNITKTAEETEKGLITKYEVEKLSEGQPSPSSLTPTEQSFVEETRKMISDGHNITEQIFITASQQDIYNYEISEDRAKELYRLL
ncbi:hypothetical protein [Oceanihabitans sediminis]|uniref:hypothetical protein n=1 Tax=Oceanihabitans sediminis TaxID=1812012 RepID=UPI00299EC8C8|nr:hypothetical protein [Oceanihabitans sediminis]MDX1279381.1 hypothetical protein [Oceanihabitans sediminis]